MQRQQVDAERQAQPAAANRSENDAFVQGGTHSSRFEEAKIGIRSGMCKGGSPVRRGIPTAARRNEGKETVVSECGARCFSGGQARKTCPPEYRRPGGGRPSRLDFFSPGRLPFPSNVMGYGWSRLRCMGSGSRTRVRAVRREELPHGVGAYFAAESRSGSDGGAEASEIGISVCASSPARIRPPCRRGRANGRKPGCGPVVSDRLPGQKDRSIRFRLRPGP